MMDKTTPMQSKPLVDVTCKLGTKGCFADGRCHALGNCENKIVTNADRIRAMNDYELSVFLAKTKAKLDRLDLLVIAYSTKDVAENLEWLLQPAYEDNHD